MRHALTTGWYHSCVFNRATTGTFEWTIWTPLLFYYLVSITWSVVFFPHLFHPLTPKLRRNSTVWWRNPPDVHFPSKDSTSFLPILSLLFLSSRVLSGWNGTLCVKKRGSESIIKARRLHAQRRMVSPSSVCRASFIVYKRHLWCHAVWAIGDTRAHFFSSPWAFQLIRSFLFNFSVWLRWIQQRRKGDLFAGWWSTVGFVNSLYRWRRGIAPGETGITSDLFKV